MYISIHALLAESDPEKSESLTTYLDFYPRSPCGERLRQILRTVFEMLISIHALLAESDRFGCGNILVMSEFLSTLSLRRATTWQRGSRVTYVEISIHALLAESDCGCCARCRYWGYFYPRSPCGERHINKQSITASRNISIHALLAESDIKLIYNNIKFQIISIHALLAESDIKMSDMFGSATIISIHALLAESDFLNF